MKLPSAYWARPLLDLCPEEVEEADQENEAANPQGPSVCDEQITHEEASKQASPAIASAFLEAITHDDVDKEGIKEQHYAKCIVLLGTGVCLPTGKRCSWAQGKSECCFYGHAGLCG